jgi:hypothetical protein
VLASCHTSVVKTKANHQLPLTLLRSYRTLSSLRTPSCQNISLPAPGQLIACILWAVDVAMRSAVMVAAAL